MNIFLLQAVQRQQTQAGAFGRMRKRRYWGILSIANLHQADMGLRDV